MIPPDPPAPSNSEQTSNHESAPLDEGEPNSLLTSLLASLPFGAAHVGDDGRKLVWTPHQVPILIRANLHDTPEGARHIVDSRVPIASGITVARYLPLLALYARRLDPIGMLTLDDKGNLSSNARFSFLRDMRDDQRNSVVRDVLTTQALQVELLIWHAFLANLLSYDEVPLPNSEGSPPWQRPDTLFAVTNDLGLRGMKNIAMVLLDESSKLGPWFVGTRQDEMLKRRVEHGWKRVASATGHSVRLFAAPGVDDALEEIRLNWAHHSHVLGPALQITVVSRLLLGEDPAQTLSALSRVPDLHPTNAHSGTWVPASWRNSSEMELLASAATQAGQTSKNSLDPWAKHINQPFASLDPTDCAAFLLAVPTGFAVPGLLATIWSWAEHRVRTSVEYMQRGVN